MVKANVMSFNRYALLLHALIFITIFDASGVTVEGVTIRIAWVFAPLAMLFIKLKKITLLEIIFLLIFSFTHLASSLYNSNYAGFSYIIWIFFNYLIFYRLAGGKEFYSKVDVSRVFILSGRLQIIIGALLAVLFQQERLSFTYYEPSYMAVGLIPFITFSLLNKNVQVIDVLCIALFVVLGQSALFVILLCVVFAVKLYQTSGICKTLLSVALLLVAIVGFAIDSYTNESRANHILVKSIIEGDFNLLFLLDRGGNRFPRMEAAFDVFSKNIFLGVGPGNYSNHISGIDFSDITRGIPWLDVHNQPPVNIFLEAGVNAGIISALVMLIIFARFAFLSFSCCIDRRYFVIIILVFVAGCLESNYLRAYCWLFFGVVAGHVTGFKMNSRLPSIKKICST